jgi:hypothetical protein
MQYPNQELRPSLSEALRRHWPNLVGLAIFPSAFFVGSDIFHISFWFFVPLFFIVNGIAAWPYLTRRAPYGFWAVACAIWMAGALFAGVLLMIIKAIAL